MLSPQPRGEICSFPVRDINDNFSDWTNFVFSVMLELKGTGSQGKGEKNKSTKRKWPAYSLVCAKGIEL